ncbi:hypothetical protein H0E87_012375, partial [Populus deltoides]
EKKTAGAAAALGGAVEAGGAPVVFAPIVGSGGWPCSLRLSCPTLLVEEMEQLLGQLRETRLWEKEGKGTPAGMGQRLLVEERLLLAGEGRRRCWNRLEREKENLPWP